MTGEVVPFPQHLSDEAFLHLVMEQADLAERKKLLAAASRDQLLGFLNYLQAGILELQELYHTANGCLK